MKKENRFYVYLHIYATGENSGRVFYVGKGTGTRAYSNSSRNRHWHNINNKYGRKVKIIKRDLTSEQACDFEVKKIKEIGIDNLCNKSSGGDSGALGITHTKEVREKLSRLGKDRMKRIMSSPNFTHPREGMALDDEVKSAISKKVKIYWDSISKEERESRGRKTSEGLRSPDVVKKRSANNKRELNPMFDSKKRRFLHKNGEEYFGTQYDFVIKFNLNKGNVSSMINGKRKTVSGWSCENANS